MSIIGTMVHIINNINNTLLTGSHEQAQNIPISLRRRTT